MPGQGILSAGLLITKYSLHLVRPGTEMEHMKSCTAHSTTCELEQRAQPAVHPGAEQKQSPHLTGNARLWPHPRAQATSGAGPVSHLPPH